MSKLNLFLVIVFASLSSIAVADDSSDPAKPSIEREYNRAMNRKPAKDGGVVEKIVKDPIEALKGSSTDGEKIPVVENAFKPFEKSLLTPEQREFRARAINAMWATPLGQMISFYLQNTDDQLEQPGYSRQLAQRMMSNAPQSGTRIGAKNALVADLIARGKFNEEMFRRIAMLDADLKDLSEAGMGRIKSLGVKAMLIVLGGSILYGFTGVQDLVRAGWKQVSIMKFIPLLAEGRFKYTPTIIPPTFFTVGGWILMTHYMGLDQGMALVGESSKDVLLLNGLDEIIKALQ